MMENGLNETLEAVESLLVHSKRLEADWIAAQGEFRRIRDEVLRACSDLLEVGKNDSGIVNSESSSPLANLLASSAAKPNESDVERRARLMLQRRLAAMSPQPAQPTHSGVSPSQELLDTLETVCGWLNVNAKSRGGWKGTVIALIEQLRNRENGGTEAAPVGFKDLHLEYSSDEYYRMRRELEESEKGDQPLPFNETSGGLAHLKDDASVALNTTKDADIDIATDGAQNAHNDSLKHFGSIADRIRSFEVQAQKIETPKSPAGTQATPSITWTAFSDKPGDRAPEDQVQSSPEQTPSLDGRQIASPPKNPFDSATPIKSRSADGKSTDGFLSPPSENEDVFSDEYEVEESWLQSHIDPFTAAEFQSNVVNRAILFDLANDSDEEESEPRVDIDHLKNTWAQSVNQTIVDSVAKEERKRQEAIFELIHTERSYVKSMQTLLQSFYMPLRQRVVLSPADLAAIFINSESLLVCHVQILSDFEDLQQKDKLIVQRIGGCLLKHIESTRTASRTDDGEFSLLGYLEYCSNQMTASKLLQKKREQNSHFQEFLKDTAKSPACGGLDLTAFLLEPMQRITRYPLLIKQIVHYTPKDHPDQPKLLEALQLFESLLSRVNMAAKESESRVQLVELNNAILWDTVETKADGTRHQFQLDLMSATRTMGPRILLYDGPLSKAKSGKKLHVFLFNDMVLLTTHTKESGKKYKLYRKPLPLIEAMLRQNNDSQKKTDPSKDVNIDIFHEDSILSLKAPDARSRKTWVRNLDEALTAVRSAENSSARKLASIPNHLKTCIGTLSVFVLSATALRINQHNEHLNTQTAVYCRVSTGDQSGQTALKPVDPHSGLVKWNQPLLFSLLTLDGNLEIKMYLSDKYSKDEPVGHCKIQMDFLEYYAGRDTERIELTVSTGGTLAIRMNYKPQI